MGWLGWSEEQLLSSSPHAVEVAHKGRVQMLKMCFGSSDKPKSPKPTADAIKSFVKMNNAVIKAQKNQKET